jgi:phosphatidylglycerol:prolipoprotein diacylglycerol transferase
MFVNNIDPTILKLGIFEIRFYGIVYVIGFLLVYWLIYRKRKELGIKREQVDNLIIILFLGLLIGARLFHFLFDEPSVFLSNPFEIFMVWHGGMSFFGAFLGCLVAAIWYLKKINLDWKKFADIIVIAATIALILGRIANFINGELVGTPSTLPWCVIFPMTDSVCRHPYQIYASISHALLFIVLLFVNKIKNVKMLRGGVVFVSFVIGYSFLRFLTDFFRADLRYFGLTIWQYISIIVFLIGIIYCIKQKIYKPLKKDSFGDRID